MSTYALYRVAQGLNAVLPNRASLWLAERVADAHWRSSPVDRAAVQANLTVVLGRPVAEDSPLVHDVFRNFARYLVEFFSAHRLQGNGPTIEGVEQLRNRLPSDQGCIILTAHLGNWELGAMVLARLGVRMSAVALPHEDPRTNQLFDAQRRRCGVHIVPRSVGATHHCLNLLRTRGVLGLVGDREFGSNGIRVSYFGRAVILPRGPAILSLRTGVPVVPVFLVREGSWRLRFHVAPAIWPPACAPEASLGFAERSRASGADRPKSAQRRAHAQVLALTQRYAHVIEHVVRQFPTQWVIFQPLLGNPATRSADCAVPVPLHSGQAGAIQAAW